MSKTPMIVLNNQLCLFNDKSHTCNLYFMQLQICALIFQWTIFYVYLKEKKKHHDQLQFVKINYSLAHDTLVECSMLYFLI